MTLYASNPLNCSIRLTQLDLVVKMETADGQPGKTVEVLPSPDVEVAAGATIGVTFEAQALQVGSATIEAVRYCLNDFLPQRDVLLGRGKRLQDTKQQRLEPTYAGDTHLRVDVLSSLPRISLSSAPQSKDITHGAEIPCQMDFANTGVVDIKQMHITLHPQGFLSPNVSGETWHTANSATSILSPKLPPEGLVAGNTVSMHFNLHAVLPGHHILQLRAELTDAVSKELWSL